MDDKLKKVMDTKDAIFAKIDSFNPDGLKLDEVTIRMGGKTCKLVVVEEAPMPGEKEIREEYISKIKDRLKGMQDFIQNKMVEMLSGIEATKDEFLRKERVLEERLANASPMPEVSWAHAQKGVTVSKGTSAGEVNWYVRGLYWPKRYNDKEIEASFGKKLMTPVTFLIRTRGKQVVSVSIRKVQDLSAFQHYHMMDSNNDCWGYWKHPTAWNTADDIIRIAREAEAVLDKINGDSIAQQNPRGLPMLDTLKRHLVDPRTTPTAPKPMVDQDMRRQGLDTIINLDNDTWSV